MHKDYYGVLLGVITIAIFIFLIAPKEEETVKKEIVKVLKIEKRIISNPIKSYLNDTLIEIIPKYTKYFNISSYELIDVISAQIILETGWLKSESARYYNNVLGLKSKNDEDYVSMNGWEVVNGKRIDMRMEFRKFNSIEACVEAYFEDFILNPRYAMVRRTDNPKEYFIALQACGYATDPDYAWKLWNLYNK